MFYVNCTLKVIDQYNEETLISTDGTNMVEFLNNTLYVYDNVTYKTRILDSRERIVYTVSRAPVTIYINIKRIEIQRGTPIKRRYIRFSDEISW